LEGRRSFPPARGRRRSRSSSKEDELVFILRTIILSAVENHLVTRKNTEPCEKSRKKTRVFLRFNGRELAPSGARSSCAQFELFLRVPGLRSYTESGKQSS
jgi:hypothetical protein